MQKLNHSRFWLGGKRLFDIVSSSIALALLSPLMVVIAILIKLWSPGPVFYRGLRAGKGNSRFYILKYRSMVVDAESIGGPTTGTNDKRVTPIGRFLRKTKLDELPQLINVVKGDMSVVGPRPEVPLYTDMYVGDEKLILEMRPGITDFSSIEFADLDDRVGSDDPDKYFREHILPKKNKLRVQYVTTWSFWIDFVLIFRTFVKIAQKLGLKKR